MEKEIKLYVVRIRFGAEVYGSLDGATAAVGSYLSNLSFDATATIECWRSTQKITEGWQWISYGRQRIASRAAFDNASADGRLEFFAKNFAKNFAKKVGCGYMRGDVYTFSVVSNRKATENTELYGSLNGRPINVEFLRTYQRAPMYLARF